MTRFVGTPLRGIEFSSVSDEAISARVNGDSHPRIRIDAGGRITWSGGSVAGDTTLYRDAADLLVTDDVFKATGGLVTLATDGAPNQELPNGAVAIDTTNHVFYFRSNSTWNQVTGGGGASIEIGDTPPAGPATGDLWFESDTGSIFVYYDSAWVEMGSSSSGGASDLDGLDDVVLTSPSNGQVLKYNGTNWVNDTDDAGTTINSLDDIGDVDTTAPSSGSFLMWDGTKWKDQAIELGNNTTGNYVSGIIAGTGVTVTHTPGEGSSPTVEIGQAVGTTDDVQFNDVTVSGNLTVSGTTTTLNTETLLVEDNVITLNSNAAGPTVASAGIEVYRGSGEFVPVLRWNETNEKWEISTDGTNYDAIQTETPFNALEQKVRNSMTYLMCEVTP